LSIGSPGGLSGSDIMSASNLSLAHSSLFSL
jgi:hypothetical protein